MEYGNFVCFECSKTLKDINNLIQHIKYLHPFVQSYVCKQDKCYRTFPLLNSLKKHLMKKHAEHKTSRQSDIKEQIESNFSNCLVHQNVTQNTFNEEANLMSLLKNFSKEAVVFGSVTINNIKYTVNNVLQINDTVSDCLIKFGLLQYIIYDNKYIIFILSSLTNISFEDRLQAYEIAINKDAQCFLVHWEDLPNKFPYNIHIMGNGKNHIVPLQ